MASYSIEQRGGKWHVIKDGGESVGSHDLKSGAIAQKAKLVGVKVEAADGRAGKAGYMKSSG